MINRESKLLYYCSTAFQLFSVLNMRISIHPDVMQADLILDNSTDFSAYIEKIRESGLFGEVFLFDAKTVRNEWLALSTQNKNDVSRDPSAFLKINSFFIKYTDLFIGNTWALHKLFYYSLVSQGMNPAIHLYEDGTASYCVNIQSTEETIDHKFYGDNAYTKRLEEILLYEPCLFTGIVPCAINPLVKVYRNNTILQSKLHEIFGFNSLPIERFIFFEEASMEDMYPCNDFELFEDIARLVGRENIIVKRHPRNKADRFTPAGYRVMPNQTVPWEVVLLQNSPADKVLVTLTSGATMTPHVVFGEDTDAIHLAFMMHGNTPITYHKEFFEFYEKLVSVLNEGTVCVRRPHTIKELSEIIKFLDGKKRVKERSAGVYSE